MQKRMFQKICPIFLTINISYILLAFFFGTILPAGSPNFSPIYYFALSLIYYHEYHLTYLHIIFGIVLAVFSIVEHIRKTDINGKFLILVAIDVLINIFWEIIASFLISIR